MSGIPAFCEQCKFVFNSNFVGDISKGATIHLGNCGVPCPKCGGMAKILDGVYKRVGRAIEIFVENQGIDDLKKILSILEYAKKHELGHEEIVEKIKKDAPELSKFSDVLPQTRVELYTFLMLIIMFIGQLIALHRRDLSKNELAQHFEVMVNQYYLHNEEKSATQKVTTKEKEANNSKVGRNAPCPCGSGRKYKKCCGK
ncbi:MAG TPA: SEC-C metal-binding domain-containing protein [Sedimentisphaerales bacterium]|nr:SEC-C metal-binding domain-containing protein [Sedimentisphaerales bacterium]